jgi:DNA-binding response OmpR family regulator
MPERTAVALAVSPLPADRARLREILSQGNWELHEASDCCGALALLRNQRVAVLLCERDHSDGNWEDLLKATARLPDPPNLVVFSRLADEVLWAKVLNLGGFDVLRRLSSRRGLASHLRRLEPLGMRLWCEQRQRGDW